MPAAEPAAHPVLLSRLTTLGLGGPAPRLTTVTSPDELIEALPDPSDEVSPLVIGGGSNLVVADAGVDAPVIRVAIGGFGITPGGTEHANLTIGAGENWDDVVARVVDAGYSGIETLSGIPGSAGATPIQNVGAYGTEIADVLEGVETVARGTRIRRRMDAADLGLGYRTSFLRGTDTDVVVAVRIRLRRGPQPVRYAELARTLGVDLGAAVPASAVREAVLELRRSKGMVVDPDDPDTCSAGSFFTNPIQSDDQLAITRKAIAERLGPAVEFPTYPIDGHTATYPVDGRTTTHPAGRRTKLSAAWLIDRAGFAKGFALPGRRVAVSTKHTLALTNRGGGTTAELLELATVIRDGVREAFGVTLHPEPILIGVRMPD